MDQDDAVVAELPLEGAGAQLKRARETAGKSLDQMSAQTRIPERHLIAIEAGDFAALPARTYAVGFSRSYAKALGLDDAVIVAAVRGELAEQQADPPRRSAPAFEPGDPARLPGRRAAWLAGLGVLVVLVAVYFGARPMLAPSGSLPSILPSSTPTPTTAAMAPTTAKPAGGPVMFTALEPGIWVKFSDGQGSQLLQKQMAQGESYTVPDTAGAVTIWTGRPEALAITIGGQAVPKLSEVQKTIKDVPVTAAALLARVAPGAAPTGETTNNAKPAATAYPRSGSKRPAVSPVHVAGTSAESPVSSQVSPPAQTPAAPAT